MKHYATYKPTGIAWLPQIPEHWEQFKLRQLLKSFSEKNHPDMPLLSVVREKGVIVRNIEDTDENHNFIPDDLRNYKLVKRGQFAMNKMKAWQGSYGVSKFDGIVSPAYFVFDFNHDMNKDFFNTAIRSKAYISYFGQASDGIRVGQWDLSMNRMKDIPFFLPPRDEQDQIVRFLDWKVSKINNLINKKRKEKEELKKLKKAIISNTITKGLFSEIPMKKSGTPWLDNIPHHWELIKLKKLVTLSETKIANSKLPYIGMENVISWEGKYHIEKKLVPESICPVFSIGNILFGKLRPYLAKAIIADFDGICSGEFLVLKEIKCNAHFLLYYLLSEQFIDNINSSTYGSKMPRANWGYIGSQLVPIPPINEQEEIVCYLDEKCGYIDHSIKLIERMLDSLQNLKNRLIPDVVTGKIDVRGIEIPEYEFIAEESLDEADAPEDEMGSEVEEN